MKIPSLQNLCISTVLKDIDTGVQKIPPSSYSLLSHHASDMLIKRIFTSPTERRLECLEYLANNTINRASIDDIIDLDEIEKIHRCLNSTFKNVKILDISNFAFEDISWLESFPYLEALNLHCRRLISTQNVFSTINRAAPNLKEIALLELRKVEIHDINFLALEALHITNCDRFDISGMQASKLRSVSLVSCNVEHLQGVKFPSIEHLSLEEIKNCDSIPQFCITFAPNVNKLSLITVNLFSLANLALSELKAIQVSRCCMPLRGIKDFKGVAPELQELSLSRTDLASLQEGVLFPKLEILQLKKCKNISKDQFSYICSIAPHIKKLNLAYTDIDSVHELNFPQLEEIDFTGCEKISSQTLLELMKNTPQLKILNLTNTNIETLEGLSFPELQVLDLKGCQKITNEHFQHLNKISPHLKRLNLTGTAIQSLQGLRLANLEKLIVWDLDFVNKNEIYCHRLTPEELVGCDVPEDCEIIA